MKRVRRRRAYALPIVVLLALVGTIVVSAILEYVSAQSRSVGRQLSSYEEHHMSRGLREVIGAWMQRARADDIREYLAPDGRAMDLEFRDGSRITIWMRDGQGTALRDLTQLSGPDLDDGRAVLRSIARGASDDARFLELTRAVGPLAVSAHSAEHSLLSMIAEALVTEGDSSKFVSEVISARDAGQLDRAHYQQAMVSAGLTADERTRIERAITLEPTVWSVEAEIHRRDARTLGGWVDERYAGLAPIRRQRGGNTRTTGDISTIFQPLGAFLTWEQVDRDTISNTGGQPR